MSVDHAAALRALRRADLEWTARLSDVWRDPPADVPELHAAERAELAEELELLADRRDDRDGRSPLGRFVVGPGGSGKTHLLGALRRACLARGAAFVLVDMTDVKDFWQTALQGFLDSLQEAGPDGRPQYRMLLDAVVRRAHRGGGTGNGAGSGAAAFAEVGSRRTTDLAADVKTLLAALHREHRAEARRYQETLRALVCLNSDDWEISQTGYGLLQGQPVDPHMVAKLGFNGGRTPGGGTAADGSDGANGGAGEPGAFADGPDGISRGRRSEPRAIVRALSWVMSLAGPAVVAFDQLDPIVQQVRFRGGRDGAESGDPADAAERAAARAILEAIGGGLGAMRDTVSRTLTVVACVEATWDLLRETVLSTNLDRFAPPAVLGRAAAPQIARTLVGGRLAEAYGEAGFAPPHPTWPFAAAAFEDLVNQTPREVLKLCDAHRTACRRAGEVTELASFRTDTPGPAPTQPAAAATPAAPAGSPSRTVPPVDGADAFAALDGRFDELRAQADPAFLLEDKREDERQAPLLRSVLKCLVREHAADLPADVDAEVEDRFPGGPNNALHARLRLTFVGEGNREEHHAVRALPRTNATAYQNRLKAATTGAGIDRDLGFRRLVIVRVPPPPSGRVTAQLTADFEAAGGRFFAPSDDQVRVLHALHALLEDRDPDFDDWLRARRPATAAGLGDALAPGSSLLSHESRDRQGTQPVPIEAEPRESDSPETVPDERDPAASPVPGGPAGGTPAPRFDSSDLPFGRRVVGGQPSHDWATAPVRALRKHTLVLGGAGAGKSVTLRRLVEEAALRGVPSIVVDHAGDLAAFDQDWPAPPDGWAEGDAERAGQFAALREQVVWTPGSVGGGNPLTLRPLPDFTPFADDPGGRADAVKMAAGGLADIVARGSGRSASAKEGLLMASLDYFARVLPAGGLDGFIGLLDDFPPGAGTGVTNEAKLAGQMADDLKSERAKNPLLGGAADAIPLDPAVLFGDDRPRDTVRISVLSLAKLTEPARPAFLNQLATELFPWLRRHPAPPGGRALRGLLVIDEARDFVPSGKSTVCKESVMKLASQGRKYGLGLVLATQHPTEIDNRAVANCSTQLFGRANSPRAQEVVRNALIQAGGEGRDVGTLPVGRFYVSCPDAGLKPPVKAQVPMSLSRTPDNPLGEPELLAKADRDRQRLAAE